MKTTRELRDYGLGESTNKVRSRPRIRAVPDEVEQKYRTNGGCPNCGCPTLIEVEVEVEDPRLRGTRGTGRYLSCPACPLAFPMVMTSGEPGPEVIQAGDEVWWPNKGWAKASDDEVGRPASDFPGVRRPMYITVVDPEK